MAVFNDRRRVAIFKSTSATKPLNYFNHSSTEEAIFELGRYLPLLSILRGQINSACFDAMTVLLCHLHLPACPRLTLSVSYCQRFMRDCSSRLLPLIRQTMQPRYLLYPQVNCSDENWFSVNSTWIQSKYYDCVGKNKQQATL